MDSRRLRINIDNILVLLIYLSVFLNSIAAILYKQANTAESWEKIVAYARLLIVFLDIIYIFHYYLHGRIVFHKYILSVYLYLVYAVLVSMMFFRPSMINFVSNAFPWPLTFVAFYMYGERNEITPFFCKVLVITNIVLCLLLVRTIQTRNMDGTNVGTVYYGIACLPMILVFCNRNEKILFSVAISAITLLSSKRAGTITLLVGFSLFFIIRVLQTEQTRKKIRRIVWLVVLTSIAVYVAKYYIDNYNSAIMARFNTLSVDQGSGRALIWNQIIESFRYSSRGKQIFGHGYHAVPFEIKPFGNYIYAHNSFLETLYDMGVIGLAWMIIMIIYMIYVMIRLIKDKNEIAPASAFAMVIVLVFSLVSYFFDESGTIMYIACFWGLVHAVYNKSRYQTLSDRKR